MAAVIGLDAERRSGPQLQEQRLKLPIIIALDRLLSQDQNPVVEEASLKRKKQAQDGFFPAKCPFHSSLLQNAGKELEKELSKVEFFVKIPYVTNVTAQCVTDISETKDLLARQISSSVLWQQSVEKMIQEGVDTFVEIGPERLWLVL